MRGYLCWIVEGRLAFKLCSSSYRVKEQDFPHFSFWNLPFWVKLLLDGVKMEEIGGRVAKLEIRSNKRDLIRGEMIQLKIPLLDQVTIGMAIRSRISSSRHKPGDIGRFNDLPF